MHKIVLVLFTALLIVSVAYTQEIQTVERVIKQELWNVIVRIGDVNKKQADFEKSFVINTEERKKSKIFLNDAWVDQFDSEYKFSVIAGERQFDTGLLYRTLNDESNWHINFLKEDGASSAALISESIPGVYCRFLFPPMSVYPNIWIAVGITKFQSPEESCSEAQSWKTGFKKLTSDEKTVTANESEIPALEAFQKLSWELYLLQSANHSRSDIEKYHSEMIVPALNDLYRKYPHFKGKRVLIKGDGFSIEIDLAKSEELDFSGASN